MNAARASCFAASVAVPVTSPGPGSGDVSSIVQHDRLDPRVLELDRLVVGEAGGGVDLALLSAVAWPNSGNSTIVTSSGVRFAEPRSAWSMIHDEP